MKPVNSTAQQHRIYKLKSTTVMEVIFYKMVNNGLFESTSEGAKKHLCVTVFRRTNTHELSYCSDASTQSGKTITVNPTILFTSTLFLTRSMDNDLGY